MGKRSSLTGASLSPFDCQPSIQASFRRSPVTPPCRDGGRGTLAGTRQGPLTEKPLPPFDGKTVKKPQRTHRSRSLDERPSTPLRGHPSIGDPCRTAVTKIGTLNTPSTLSRKKRFLGEGPKNETDSRPTNSNVSISKPYTHHKCWVSCLLPVLLGTHDKTFCYGIHLSAHMSRHMSTSAPTWSNIFRHIMCPDICSHMRRHMSTIVCVARSSWLLISGLVKYISIYVPTYVHTRTDIRPLLLWGAFLLGLCHRSDFVTCRRAVANSAAGGGKRKAGDKQGTVVVLGYRTKIEFATHDTLEKTPEINTNNFRDVTYFDPYSRST